MEINWGRLGNDPDEFFAENKYGEEFRIERVGNKLSWNALIDNVWYYSIEQGKSFDDPDSAKSDLIEFYENLKNDNADQS